nr:MAG TPA: major capsid protein [Caudoviricetes sp.]
MNKTFVKAAKKLNIRLFADPNTQTTASSGLTDEMKTYYSDYLIDLVEPRLVHDQFADKKDIPKGSGKTIEFRKYSPLAKALTPIQEGVTPNGNNLNMSTITAEIYQYGDYITLSDILQLAAIDNNVVQATKLLGSQAGRTLDTITREVMAGGTNVIIAPDADTPEEDPVARHLITANNKFTPDLAFKAKTQLAAMNAAPIDDSYVAIIHPYVSYDIMRNREWIALKDYDNADYYKGEIGKIGGLRFVESTEAKIFRGDDLAKNSRTLTVDSISGSEITFSGGKVEENALAGRFILIGDNKYEVASNTSSTITLTEEPGGGTVNNSDTIYPGEGGAKGCAVFAVTVVGTNAYATTSLEGAGLEHIVKPLGSGGTSDPLNQRSTVGWKATKAAERLVEEYMVRIECGSAYSDKAKAN